MSTQFAPDESQRIHWYDHDNGPLDHRPRVPVKTPPTRASPVTVGRAVLAGVTGVAIVAVWVDVATVVVLALVAAIATRIVAPASATVVTYVDVVAPAIVTQL